MSELARSTRCWSVPVAIEDIPETGSHLELEADAATRSAIADLASVRALPTLSASFDLTRHGSGVRVVGFVKATVEQTCVVTLEPMQTEIDEAVDLVFMPPGPEDSAPGPEGEDGDPPEVLHGGAIDLGAVAIEFLLLGIDPYPRRQGAVFQSPQSDEPADSPFAALAALKKQPSGNGR